MNATDIIKYGHSFFLNTFDGLPEADWQIPGVCGVWSVKDIVAHLAAYEGLLVEVLHQLLGRDQPQPLMKSMANQAGLDFNDYQVEQRKSQSISAVLNEYNTAHAEVVALIDRIPVAKRREVGALPWYGAEYDLEDFLVYTYYGHKREHGAEIAAFRDRFTKGNE